MNKPTNPPTIGPFGNDLLAQIKVSPEAVWGCAGTMFPHPEEEIDVVALNRFITELIVDWKHMCAHIDQ